MTRKFFSIFSLILFYLSSFVFGQSGTLQKTVGTSPETCGVSSVVTVTSGATVYYCYRMLNESYSEPFDIIPITDTIPLPGAFTFHSLLDNKLGAILNEEPFVLNPSQSFTVTVPAVITETTTNTATWEAYVPITSTISVASQILVMTTTASATVVVAALNGATAPIPTLSEWGIILLMVLLFGSGLLFLKRSGPTNTPSRH